MYESLTAPTRRRSRSGGQRSLYAVIPPPSGGINTVDNVPQMPITDAITLTNWICSPGGIITRQGYGAWGTGLSGNYVESLMEYAPAGGSNKLFAATPSVIYNVTAAGAGVSSLTSRTNGRYSHINFSTSAGKFLYAANGADTPIYYDGTNWNNSTFTGSGLTTSNLDFVHAHMNRLWFIERDTLNAWYGPTQAIAGTLTKFPLTSLATAGGKLVAIGTWSRDGGAGSDDHLVFLTSEGQAIIYAGTDPSSSTSSALVGVYRIAKPIGRRCMIRAGADLAVLSSSGLIPLSSVLPASISVMEQAAITRKASSIFSAAFAAYKNIFGWQSIEWPAGQMIIVNIPNAERATQTQLVVSTLTGGCSQWSNVLAGCFAVFNDDLYIGGNDGKVYKYASDTLDRGSFPVVAKVQCAFSTLGNPKFKIFKSVRPILQASRGFSPRVAAAVDYDTSTLTVPITSITGGGSLWDVDQWDVATWGASSVPALTWQTVQGAGIACSIGFGVSTQIVLSFQGFDIEYEEGMPH